jgi:hypothetical protein
MNLRLSAQVPEQDELERNDPILKVGNFLLR